MDILAPPGGRLTAEWEVRAPASPRRRCPGAANGKDSVQLDVLECQGFGVTCNPRNPETEPQARFGSVPHPLALF